MCGSINRPFQLFGFLLRRHDRRLPDMFGAACARQVIEIGDDQEILVARQRGVGREHLGHIAYDAPDPGGLVDHIVTSHAGPAKTYYDVPAFLSR
jgi:hypothetical protein